MYKKGRVNSNSRIISTDEDPSLRIESSAIINLRGVSTKLNKYSIEGVSQEIQKHFCCGNMFPGLPICFHTALKSHNAL